MSKDPGPCRSCGSPMRSDLDRFPHAVGFFWCTNCDAHVITAFDTSPPGEWPDPEVYGPLSEQLYGSVYREEMAENRRQWAARHAASEAEGNDPPTPHASEGGAEE